MLMISDSEQDIRLFTDPKNQSLTAILKSCTKKTILQGIVSAQSRVHYFSLPYNGSLTNIYSSWDL